MLSQSEPHGRTFSQVLQKPSRFIRRLTSSIMALARQHKAAPISRANLGGPRSGTPFLWLDGCMHLLIRHGEQGTRSEKARSPNRHDYLATGVLLMRWHHGYHMPLKTHFLLIHPLLLTAKICLLQLRACMRRRDPYHVPSQTDLINHCSHLPSFETKTSNKMASVKEARHELDPWNDNCPKTWSLKQ